MLRNDQGELIAVASKTGSLYYLNCEPVLDNPQVNTTANPAKENLWHHLAKDGLVIGLDYDVSKNIDFCVSTVENELKSH